MIYQLEIPLTTPYFVRLMGADGIPATSRIAAEIRCLMELERGLGGQQGVMAAWREDHAASAQTLWDEVFGAASVVALGEVALPGAHFIFSPVGTTVASIHDEKRPVRSPSRKSTLSIEEQLAARVRVAA